MDYCTALSRGFALIRNRPRRGPSCDAGLAPRFTLPGGELRQAGPLFEEKRLQTPDRPARAPLPWADVQQVQRKDIEFGESVVAPSGVRFRHAVYVGEAQGKEVRAPILVEERLLAAAIDNAKLIEARP